VNRVSRSKFKPCIVSCLSLTLLATLSVANAQTQYNGSTAGPYGGKYYSAVPAYLNWVDARNQAQSLYIVRSGTRHYGHLATMNTFGENQYVFYNLGQPVGYWLGGYQNLNQQYPWVGWNWVTGWPTDFTNWASGEPNDGSGNEDNTQNYLCFTNSGFWDDASGRHSGFVVEFEP